MADAIVIPLGQAAKLYYGAPGAAPSLEIAGATDVTVVLEKEDAEVTRRVSQGWKDFRESFKDCRVTFTLMGTTIDSSGTEVTVFNHLETTFLTGLYQGSGDTGIALHAVAAVAASVGFGPLGDFILTRFERTETLGEGQTYAVEARMTQSKGRVPTWTGSPV